jgi:hypothetical protein
MSLGNLKLKRITTGAFAKTIEASDEAHILQKNDPSSATPYKYMINDNDTGKWLGNIFKSSSFYMEHQNVLVGGETVRGPKSAWKHIAQCADSSFNLKEATKSGVSWTYLSDTNFTNENLGIALYNPDILGNPATNFNATSSVWVFLEGVPFNFLSDQPMSIGYYDYDQGVLQASQFKTKNMYDYDYNVSAQFIEISPTDTIGNIEDTRDYINARGGGRDVWLSYKVGADLSGLLSDTEITSAGNELSGTPIITVSEYNNKDTGVYAYEMVERFKGIVLLETTGLHKSNLFSIKLVDTKLNNAITDENVREFIQFGINNVIKELMKKITPANTQLFKIIWEGE